MKADASELGGLGAVPVRKEHGRKSDGASASVQVTLALEPGPSRGRRRVFRTCVCGVRYADIEG